MRDRTWPVLRLAFPAPLDDERHERLLLDVDDCGASALDEDGDTVSLYFSAAVDRDAAVDLLASRGWLSQATLTTEDVPDEGWGSPVAGQPASDHGRPGRRRPTVGRARRRLDRRTTRDRSRTVDRIGTGHHQTTRLCLRALQDLDLRGARVLDIGTGSGVLAVAAVRLGAAEALGIDNDPDAIESAEDTLRRNGLDRGAVVRMELRGLDDPALVPSDVVCANLTGALLRQQGARVQALMVPGGRAVLSGFTEDEARWVREAFDACDVEATHDEEFWIAYVLRRRADTSQA